jgi:hypothetical protein
MGNAAVAFVLWTRFLKHSPQDPSWPDRDRFVLSPGHGSMLLYSLLHLTGYDLPLDELKRFRQWGSRTPCHPERGHETPGVEVSTGPLGQGSANGVGMAMTEAWLAARFNRPGFNLVDHYTYEYSAVLQKSDIFASRRITFTDNEVQRRYHLAEIGSCERHRLHRDVIKSIGLALRGTLLILRTVPAQGLQ